jgi:16S rRNA (guanine527-N7)-methyltransferase
VTPATPASPGGGAEYTADAFQKETDVSRETLDRLKDYVALLEKWQKKINLVGAKTLPNVWRRHMLDSAQLLPLVRDRARSGPGRDPGAPLILVDLGSGAGFPGLVLAILDRQNPLPLEVHLTESDQKKCTFLREVARITGVTVTVHGARAEDLDPFPADVVTARACAPLDRLLGYSHQFWGPHTRGLFLKGLDVDKEIVQAGKSWGMVTELCPSRSDPTGIVLCVKDLRKGGA